MLTIVHLKHFKHATNKFGEKKNSFINLDYIACLFASSILVLHQGKIGVTTRPENRENSK